MATTQIRASGNSATPSSSFTIASGQSRTVIMRAAGGSPEAWVEIQGADSSWTPFAKLDFQTRVRGIAFPGVYRVVPVAGDINIAIDLAD